MNFQFAIIFGYDYEGENAETLRLFESMDQIGDIIEETLKEWSGVNYYTIGLIHSNGRIEYTERVAV